VRQQPIDAQRKAVALKLAAEHGSAEASRRTGVSAATIRYWRHKAAKAARPRDADADSIARLERLLAEQRAAAEESLAKAREAVAAGRGTEARNLMICHGIAVQRGADLAADLRSAREHEIQVADEQAKLMVAVLERVFRDLGLERAYGPGSPARKVLAHHLRARAEPDGPAPDAAEARAAVRAEVLSTAKAKGFVEARCELPRAEDDAPRALPAPRVSHASPRRSADVAWDLRGLAS
jgi:DNA-binding transcriptional MerR regulator